MEDKDAIRLHFGVRHHLLRECQDGHVQMVKATDVALNPFPISEHDTKLARAATGKQTLTIGDFFRNTIPRVGHFVYHQNSELMVHNITTDKCSHEGCSHRPHNTAVITDWPLMLLITPEYFNHVVEYFGDGSQYVQPLTRFTLHALPPSQHGEADNENGDEESGDIIYEIVGRLRFIPEQLHYVTEILHSDRVFLYDGMKHGGVAKDIGDRSLLEQPKRGVALLIYHRRSKTSVSPRCQIPFLQSNEVDIC